MIKVDFFIHARMGERWIPHFLAFLKQMQKNGEQGHSETLAFFSDGDGDFRPQFKFLVDDEIEASSREVTPKKCNPEMEVKLYDAE